MIYCIGNRAQGVCKIGFTDKVKPRLAVLQSSTPFDLTLFAERKGSKKDEAALHLKFLKYRVRGEWFAINQEVADYFGFVLAPPMSLYAVYLAYVKRTEIGQIQHAEMLTVWASCPKEAIATAKTKLNILGYFLGAVAGVIPVEDMQKAIAKDASERDVVALTEHPITLYTADEQILVPQRSFGAAG